MLLIRSFLAAAILAGSLVAAAQEAGVVPAPDLPPRAPRPFSLRADYGGTEPGTSKQAFEGVATVRPSDDWQVDAGGTWSDLGFYSSARGHLGGYRFLNDGLSYLKAAASLRKYQYPTDPTLMRPNPDANAYGWVQRGELEGSHPLTDWLRATAQYQVFRASFFHDGSSWAVNHKVSGELELRVLPQLRVAARAAALRDPDPNGFQMRGRLIPGTGGTTGVPAAYYAGTRFAYRWSSLVGGWAQLDLARVSGRVEYLPNRDLDNSYAWSLLSTLDLRLTARADLRLQHVYDRYSSLSSFRGRTAEIYMAAAGYALTDSLRVRGGYRHVDTPSYTGPGRSAYGSLILGMEWRSAL
jgi:hypothetical protein